MTVRFLPVEFDGDGNTSHGFSPDYLQELGRLVQIAERGMARLTGKPYTLTAIVEDIVRLPTSDFPPQLSYTSAEADEWFSKVYERLGETYGCTARRFCSVDSEVHGCMVVTANAGLNAAYNGYGLSVAQLGIPHAFLHELLHAQAASAHDRCNVATQGVAYEYGNRYSSLGRAMTMGVLADPVPPPGLGSVLQHNLLQSTGQLVDIAADGQRVTLSAFDVFATRSDPSSVLGARLSHDTVQPHYYLLVAYRALIDVYSSHDGASAATRPPAGGVVITGHYSLGERGYSTSASLIDTSPGSVVSDQSSRVNDCDDAALRAGQQFWLSDLDVVIEVDHVSQVGYHADTRSRDQDAIWERVMALDQVAEQATAVVSFFRISGLPARRAIDCGNGVRDPSEQCDGGDGCNDDCQCAPGYEIIPGNVRHASCRPVCGNGQHDYLEECDPSAGGNAGSNCDAATCRCTAGYAPLFLGNSHGYPRRGTTTCYESSSPFEGTCGNGVRDNDEVCDGTVGCNANCQCDARPEYVVNGKDNAVSLKSRGSSGMLRSLVEVTGECLAWFETNDAATWAPSFRGTYGDFTDFRGAPTSEDRSGPLSGFVVAAVIVSAVLCCAAVAACAVVLLVAIRRRGRQSHTSAQPRHATVCASRRASYHGVTRSRSPSTHGQARV